jgi:hypothetical protein
MGMHATANLEAVFHTPIWSVRGEEDWYCRNLPEQIDTLRKMNGDHRGPMEWVSGVNPRYSSFEGVGHGVQWDAASTLPLVEWAYQKINDGNIYPVVYIESLGNRTMFQQEGTIEIELYADDPDGSIVSIQVFVNSEMTTELSESPYKLEIDLDPGDNLIEAIACDLHGKCTKARLLLQVDVKPVIETLELPDLEAGRSYHTQLSGSGNQPLLYNVSEGSLLPEGLSIERSGLIAGIPTVPGNFSFSIELDDAGEVEHLREYRVVVKEKDPGVVIVTDVHYPHDSLQARVSTIKTGGLPNIQTNSEVSFSDVGIYRGFTYIMTSQYAANMDREDLLTFTVDENVIVYVAYESLNRQYSSSVPDWLKEFEKESGDPIVAQYRTFDIYSKPFPAGTITLPGADSQNHNVSRNYFLMVNKD